MEPDSQLLQDPVHIASVQAVSVNCKQKIFCELKITNDWQTAGLQIQVQSDLGLFAKSWSSTFEAFFLDPFLLKKFFKN